MNNNYFYDIVILVPGKDEEQAISALLSKRQRSLKIRDVTYKILVHHQRDAGCFYGGPDILQAFQQRARYALILLDHEGSGQETMSCETMESDLQSRLIASGWGNRARVIVIEPELEIWIWSDSPWVDKLLGWHNHTSSLRNWLAQKNMWPLGYLKPVRPKESLETALRKARIRRSSAIYGELARRVSLRRCNDTSFCRLKNLLISWLAKE